MEKWLARLRKDDEGAALAEFAVLISVFLLVLGGIIDFSMAFWQWNQAIKAVERGARIAAVSNPVASSLTALNPAGCVNPGDPNPQVSFPKITCDGSSSSCTGATGVTYNATAMNWIVYGRGQSACATSPTSAYAVGMCNILAKIKPQNVVVEYRQTGLGFCGRPGGPVPTIEVSLKSTTAHPLKFDFLFLGGLLGLNQITFPAVKTSITGEDLLSSGS